MKINRTLAGVGLLGILLVALVVLFQWNWLRGPIGRFVTEETGREFVIDGDLEVELGRVTRVTMHKVRFRNAGWAKAPLMGSADRLGFAIDIPALLEHRVELRQLDLAGADVSLERAGDGRRNWVLSKEEGPETAAPEIQLLSISDSRIAYRDAMLDADIAAEVTTDGKDVERPTQISLSGRYRKVPVSGFATAGPVLSLRDSKRPFPARIDARIGKTSVGIDGSFADLAKFGKIDAQLRLAGPDLSQLYPVIPLALPTTPAYRIEGRLSRDGNRYSYEGFSGMIGRSDIRGDVLFVDESPRPFFKASLDSNLLDLKDLAPLIGARPARSKAAPAPKAADSTAERPSQKAVPRKVLPAEAFNLDRLNAMNAEVSLSAKQILRPDELPLDNMRTRLLLTNGDLKLDPLEFGFSGGRIAAKIGIDARQTPMAAQADVDLFNVKLEQLFPTLDLMRASFGLIGAQLRLSARGNSIATLMGNANGEATFAMGGGEYSGLLLEALALNGAGILKYLALGDKELPNRCSVAAFDIKNGVATSRVMVFDTTVSNIQGEGRIDFRQEQLDLVLKPEPKKKSFLVARTPIRVFGPFSAPDYSLEKGPLVARGGAALALGVLNPFAALLALVETGPGKDADCKSLLAQVDGARRQATRPAAPSPIR